ncbi:hypothetical protein E0Z10_g9283 [Xylaria hypoxylon]|uniref:2EXR domain-containing protein n=1 Tax=Xylaria hypoxylon TaxID=37992 RepID=A0A4Z0Y968_9PEZI|nr:hypothetical protein E0Z10_g9283 [Xylaria hypoxylon]
MLDTFSHPTFWLEFRLLSDGLETATVQTLPLTAWHKTNNPVFHLFSALPPELRLRVWEYLIAPRIVGIACLYLEDGASSVEVQREELWGSHPVIRPSVPVLLHVSRETRALALKHYELSFEWKVPRVLAGADMHPPVPVRSPILAAPAPPRPPLTHPSSQPASNSASLSHMSSYHDLLDPSPEPSTSRRGESSSTGLENSIVRERRTSSPPRTWFNFDLDAVYLLGELEPCDSFGFNSPMTYFIPSQTARRVRKAAVSFGALRYGETGGQQIFGALFHVVDRFAPVDGEVLVCVTERDEWTHAMMGNETALVGSRPFSNSNSNSNSSGSSANHGDEGNVVQKIWRDWYRGAIVTSPLVNLRFSLIPEKELETHVYDFMVATPGKQRKKKKEGEAGTTESGGRAVETNLGR